jgi:hypothetical protein
MVIVMLILTLTSEKIIIVVLMTKQPQNIMAYFQSMPLCLFPVVMRLKQKPRAAVYACNPSYSGGKGRRRARSGAAQAR